MKDGSAPAGKPGSAFREDVHKYYRIAFGTETPALRDRLRLWATNFGFHCVAAYRLDRFARRVRARHRWAAPLVAASSLLGHGMELLHHVRIYAEVGPGFFIGHAGMIYIGPTTIGSNFSVAHNVTIGLGQSEGAAGFPVIGDDVWVGTGCVLAGAIHVGDGATVAHGTMLSRSVPARSLAVGNPGRVVLQGYDNGPLLGRPRQRPGAAEAPPGEPPAPATATG